MKKNKNTILIVLGIALFCATPVLAGGLNVVFESGTNPLFQEANFLPGGSVSRWVEVTNNADETKKIGLEIINNSLCSGSCLSDILDLVVSENGTTLYTGSLTTFYGAGEKALSDLGVGQKTKYDFSMTFNPSAGNSYQNAITDFDIKIGFFGEESIGEEIIPGGGGGSGGSSFTAGLEIYDEQASVIDESSVTIIWNTNHNSTSRVIYSPSGFPHLLQLSNPPNYGYIFSTNEDPNRVINHSVTLTGLLPCVTYYYRCVSHGSFAMSTEYSFTTSVDGEDRIIVENPQDEVKNEIRQVVVKGMTYVADGESEKTPEETAEEVIQEVTQEATQEVTEENSPSAVRGGFLASIGDLFKSINLCLLLFLVIIILLIISLLSIDRKNKQKRNWWFLNIAIIILIILYYFLCTFSLYYWIVIFILVILIVLSLIFRKKDTNSSL